MSQAELPPSPPHPSTVIILPLALPIERAVLVSGLSRSAIYREAGAGNVVLKKIGRTTLVDMESVRTFLDSLPRANIRKQR